MNKPLDMQVESARGERSDYVLSRTDKYFTKSVSYTHLTLPTILRV